MLKSITIAIVTAVFALGIQNVNAGGPRMDWDERYEDIPGAPECWIDGWDDGQNGSFDHDRNRECEDKGNQYYRAFIHGCKVVEGNTEEVCENATDS